MTIDFIRSVPFHFDPDPKDSALGYLFFGEKGQWYVGMHYFLFPDTTTMKFLVPPNTDDIIFRPNPHITHVFQPINNIWQISFLKPEGRPNNLDNFKSWFTFHIRNAIPSERSYCSDDPGIYWVVTHSGKVDFNDRLPQPQAT